MSGRAVRLQELTLREDVRLRLVGVDDLGDVCVAYLQLVDVAVVRDELVNYQVLRHVTAARLESVGDVSVRRPIERRVINIWFRHGIRIV